jgi:predicted MFS family arabinose efflux permease
MRSGPEPAHTEQLRPSPNPGIGRSWFVTGLGLGQICSWGSLYYGFPLIAEAMEQDLGWSRSSLYGAATLGLVLAALASFPVGRAVDRGHGRLLMTAGSVLAGLLFIAWSQVDSIPAFYLVVVLLGAMQAATLYEPAFAVIARRFGAGRARSGIVALTLWGGFASTVFIPMVQLLIDGQGWRGALITLGAINLTLCAGLYWAVIDPRKDAPHPPPANPADAPHDARPIRSALRSPVFWLLMLAFAAHAAAFTAFTFHMYPMLLEFGFTTTAVVAAMAIIGPAQVAGRIAISIIARRTIRLIGAITVLAFPIAFAALAFLPPTFLLVALVTLLYGAANGVITIVRGAAVPELLTERSYGAINGVMNAPATMARALAPLAAAALWTAGQSYHPVILAILAGSIVLALGFWSAAWLSRPSAKPAPTTAAP